LYITDFKLFIHVSVNNKIIHLLQICGPYQRHNQTSRRTKNG